MNLYILVVFDTLLDYHIDMALSGIQENEFEPMDFLLYNSSTQHDSVILMRKIQEMVGDRFISFNVMNVDYTKTTLEDVQNLFENVRGYDGYFVHKSDFYLSHGLVAKSLLKINEPNPVFLNFSKFDLREKLVGSDVSDLSKLTFSDIQLLEGSVDLTHVLPNDFGVKYDKIGYAGPDGVMHCYNESARQIIRIDVFCDQRNVDENRSRGVNWIFGETDFFALHMFHELPHGRNLYKDIPDYRF
jgi:hypothetical protein